MRGNMGWKTVINIELGRLSDPVEDNDIARPSQDLLQVPPERVLLLLTINCRKGVVQSKLLVEKHLSLQMDRHTADADLDNKIGIG